MRDQSSFGSDAADIRSLVGDADPAAGLAAATATARLAGIRDEILGASPPGAPRVRQHRRRRPRALVAYALVPALLAATGAAWAVIRGGGQSFIPVSCFSAASLHPPFVLDGGATPGQTPVAFCAHEWATGAFGHLHGHRVPPLVACEIPYGTYGIGVFPNTTCARLGLRPPSARYLAADRNLWAFTHGLQARLPVTHRCVPQRRAVAIARQEMGRYGYRSWHLRIESRFDLTGATLSPVTSCVSAQVFPKHHAVELYLSPGPRTAYGRFAAAFDAVGKGLSCRPGSPPFRVKELFTPRMRRLFARALPGWTMRFVGPKLDRAHPCFGEELNQRTRQWLLFRPTYLGAWRG
jgi:hypothetical protein